MKLFIDKFADKSAPVAAVLLVFLLAGPLLPSPALTGEKDVPTSAEQEVVEELPDQLWLKSQDLLEDGKIFQAARSFNHFYSRFTDHPQAEEAIWQAANLYKELAMSSEQPNWEKVGNLFREYYSAFKGTARAEEAYLEVARAHIEMKLLREGLSYISIFMKSYPASVFKPRVLVLKAETLMKVGRKDEALDLCREFIKHKTEDYRSHYPVVATIFLELGYLDTAVSLIDQAVASIPPLSEELFRVLAIKGRALTLMESTEKVKNGQELLFYLANVSEVNKLKSQVFFDVAESVLKTGEKKSAQRLYEKVLALVSKDEKVAVFSRFRISFLGDEERRTNEFQNKTLLEDPAMDKPYLDLLDNFQQESIAQDARLGLMKRLVFRGDVDSAYILGKAYLENGGGPDKVSVIETLGGILVRRMEVSLAGSKNQEVFDLYRREYSVVQDYPEGRLLFLVGQALEAMSLYDQAAVVYYRAVALNHSELQKSELYLRRAGVYIKKGDYRSAELLLDYLADIYKERRDFAEVLYLTGQLRAVQGKVEDAVGAYARAVKIPETGERRAVYAAAYVRLLHEQKRLEEMTGVLAVAANKKWLAGAELQELYGLLGDTLFERGEGGSALKAYRAALEDGLPTEGERVQTIHIRLGDILSSWGIVDKSMNHYQLASKGINERWSRIALERMQQEKIDKTVASLKTVLDK